QKAEGRRQKAEGRRQKAEGRRPFDFAQEPGRRKKEEGPSTSLRNREEGRRLFDTSSKGSVQRFAVPEPFDGVYPLALRWAGTGKKSM
ncbi:MAG: hypothetical protein LH628_08420, partial [Microcoleus sp. CAN_BIN18]|nr:hypothetical protein [Microcoleus sp. CAN_BIN18]